MTAEMVVPAWMHTQISAEQYDSWSEEQCTGIEIVDGMVVVGPSASKRHNRLARILANALDALDTSHVLWLNRPRSSPTPVAVTGIGG